MEVTVPLWKYFACGRRFVSQQTDRRRNPDRLFEEMAREFRIGHGFDVHRFRRGRKLILGGVEIPYRMGLAGHSDADVVCHAVINAVLGAMSEGDIGMHFPDTDPRYQGIASTKMLDAVLGLCGAGALNSSMWMLL